MARILDGGSVVHFGLIHLEHYDSFVYNTNVFILLFLGRSKDLKIDRRVISLTQKHFET